MVCAVAVFAADTDSTQLPAKRPRVGLVLSGGGAKGIAHVGALKVIEELGIPVDYIGGTSMGSIVGGLYALGYTSMQLEAYMKGIDWENLLGDGVRRLHVGIYEKGERRRYWLQIPLRGRKLELPMGILSGQNVSNLLTELASPAYAEEDFGKFPIPFLCVATDIKTGAGVVLERGDLARSMRASMAIPSVFTPEMIDGRQLFDGGLVDNFPVDLVREKGVDIIIGVDVGSSVGEKSVSNIAQVMEQVVFMSSQARRISGAERCDVLIIPSISEYGASNFNAADSLIARGERAARQHVDRLRALADSLRGFAPDAPVEAHAICPQPLHSFFVREVEINGLEHSTREFFLQKLELNFPAVWTFADLNRAMDKLRGSQVFQTVTYQLHPLDTPGEVEIRFDCTEQSAGVFRGGVHYDPEYKAALLLNLSQRNILLQNSRASAELSIGTNPFFALSFLHTPRMQFRKKETAQYLSPDWQFYVSGYQHGAYNYDGNRRVEEYTFAVVSTGMELLVSPTINSAAGVGITGDYSLTKTWEGSEQANNREDHQFWMRYRLFFERDTYNEDYFPTSGARIHLEAMYHHSSIVGPYQGDGFAGVMFRSGFASSPTNRWTILTGIDAGVSFGANIPHQYRMRLGGIPDRLLNRHVPFAGMYFMQRHNEHLWAAHFNNQARLWNNIFLTLRTHIAKAEDDMKELVTWRNFLIGGGVSLQYNSVVGPFGFTLSSSNVTRSVLGAFHLGFWF